MSEAHSRTQTATEPDPEQQLQNFEVGDRFGTDPAEQWEVSEIRSDGVIIESPGGCLMAARVHEDGVWLHSSAHSDNRIVEIRKFCTPMDASIGVMDRLQEGDVFEVGTHANKYRVEKVLSDAAAEVAKGGTNGWDSPNYRLKGEWGAFGVPARMEYQHRKYDHHDFEISLSDLRVL